MSEGPTDSTQECILILRELAQYASFAGETYRAKAYDGAAAALAALGRPITQEEAQASAAGKGSIRGIGKAIGAKLLEYLQSGRVAELERLRADPGIRARTEFARILGVGPATSAKWIADGIVGIASLRQAVIAGRVTLTQAQQLGLEHYADLAMRIPRDEVARLGDIMKNRLSSIGIPIKFTIAGSYRRGAESSGDIDIIVTAASPGYDAILGPEGFQRVIAADPAYIGAISTGPARMSFLYKSPEGRVRQIDILVTPPEEYGAALLYFTGSWDFNEAMRAIAKSKSMKLNQTGLYQLPKGRGASAGKGARAGKLIPASTEREIFDALGLEWVPPRDRTGPAALVLSS